MAGETWKNTVEKEVMICVRLLFQILHVNLIAESNVPMCRKELHSIILQFLVDCTVPLTLFFHNFLSHVHLLGLRRTVDLRNRIRFTLQTHRKDLQYILNTYSTQQKGFRCERPVETLLGVCSGLKRRHVHTRVYTEWPESTPRSGALEASNSVADQPKLWFCRQSRWKVALVCLEICGVINHYSAFERSSHDSLQHVA